MDPQSAQPTSPSSDVNSQSKSTSVTTSDLTKVNQEMYKKNLELAERNKTLLLLRKIDEIVLSTVTDLKEIAKQVTTILVEEGEFQASAIYLLTRDKRNLQLLGYALTKTILQQSDVVNKAVSFKHSFDVTNQQALIVQALKEHVVKTTENPYEFIEFQSNTPNSTETDLKINSTLVLPLLIRNQELGAMVVSHKSPIHMLSEYDWDLLQRLVNMVGISLDNAILYNEVQSTNQKLKVLDRLKDEFVSLASHELRTPMTAIKSYLWLFLEDNKLRLDDQQRLYVERAYLSTERLINLVNDMLNVSRIESRRLIINKQPVNIVSLIQEVVNEITPTAKEQKKSLTFTHTSPTLPYVFADPEKIKQVLTNLIGNSIKFTNDGGTITIVAGQTNNSLTVSVIDNGKGISHQDMGKLFKKFGIVGSTSVLTHGAQSTGLGLYICKSIIELNNGTIWVESKGEGQGSTFSFALPLATEEDIRKFSQESQQAEQQKQEIPSPTKIPSPLLVNQQASSAT